MPPLVESLFAAAARAPDTAGVYFFLGAGTELLYVGKAGSLRRRLHQHARAWPGAGGPRLDLLYRRVQEVRWVDLRDEQAAAVWEADLIAGLHPVFNAGSAQAGCWNYLRVQPVGGDVHRFVLARRPDLGEDPPIQQALDRDRHAAAEFFDHGSRRLRQLRLRHGRPTAPVSRAEIEQMLATEVRAAIGEIRLPAGPDPADAILGRKARPWAAPAAAGRRPG